MKKVPYILRTGLLALGLIILASCSNPADSSSDDGSGKGVIGSISGMVYDSTTAKALSGVEVRVGKRTATTGANGGWAISGVEAGTHTISYSKNGYLVKSEEIFVDGQFYKTYDPFWEYDILKRQFDALNAWIATQNPVNHPDFSGTNDPAYSWQYQDGAWVSGDGDTVVNVTTNEDGTFDFDIQDIKLDTTYEYGYSMRAVGLHALNGTLEGNLKVFYVTNTNNTSVKHEDAVAIQAGVDIYFTAPGNYLLGEYPGPMHENVADRIYGSVKTDANGKFSATGLPVNTPLEMVVGSFTQNGFYFSQGSDPYIYTTSGFSSVSTAYEAVNSEVNNNGYSIDDLYFFTEGSYAVITDYTTDMRADGSAMTVTFNKPMNPAVFSANLKIGNPSNALHMVNDAEVRLTASWNPDYTVATLTIADVPSGYANRVFPYSVDETLSIGTLTFDSGTRAQDNGTILNDEAVETVFTPEAIKLVNIELNPETIPGRALAIVTKEAIKVTFSKPVNPDARFAWGNGKEAQYVVDPADPASFFVYLDMLKKDGAGQTLDAYVVSAADPVDYFGGDDFALKSLATIEFSKGPVIWMSADKTNLYDARTDYVGADIDSGAANFPIDSNITLTFTRDIAEDAVIRAILVRDDDSLKDALSYDVNADANKNLYRALEVSRDGKVLILNPVSDLEYNATYLLAVEIVNADKQMVFGFDSDNPDSKMFGYDTGDGLVKNAVKFTTEKDPGNLPLMLQSTNIYDAKTSLGVTAADANFPVDSNLILNFASAIPDDAVVKAALVTSAPDAFDNALLDSSVALNDLMVVSAYTNERKTLTINPASNLKRDTNYYLALQISRGSEVLFGGTTTYSLFKPASGDIAVIEATNKKSIAFTTAASSLKLVSTNLYTKIDTNFIGEYVTGNVNEFSFAINGSINLTFNESIAGKIIKAALVRDGNAFTGTDGLNTSIALAPINPTGVTLSLKPSLPLMLGTDYFLRLQIEEDNDGLSTDTIFTMDDFSPYAGKMVIYNTDYTFNSIMFKTEPAYIEVTAKNPGVTSSTSSEFGSDFFDDGFLDAASSTFKLGTTYYVQFNEKLTGTFEPTYKATTDNGATINAELTVKLSKVDEYVLGITVTSNNPATDSYADVEIAVDGTPIVIGTGAATKFGSSTGDLKITLGMVSK